MDLKSMTLQEMQEYMESIGEKKFRAKQIYEWFHKHLALSLDEMNNVPKKLKEKIEQTQNRNERHFIKNYYKSDQRILIHWKNNESMKSFKSIYQSEIEEQ